MLNLSLLRMQVLGEESLCPQFPSTLQIPTPLPPNPCRAFGESLSILVNRDGYCRQSILYDFAVTIPFRVVQLTSISMCCEYFIFHFPPFKIIPTYSHSDWLLLSSDLLSLLPS